MEKLAARLQAGCPGGGGVRRYCLLDAHIQDRCLNLCGPLHHNGSITDSLSTLEQRQIDSSAMANKIIKYSHH